jgi:hypothetical protein
VDTSVTVESVLEMLRKLSPRDRLTVIARALPEVDRELSETKRPLKSLWGLCADLGPAPSAEDIDEIRREMWANFPRDDI